MKIERFEDLQIWKAAMDLTVEVNRVSKSFPQSESFNLTSQVNRAAVSVPCNIAEGFGRGPGLSQAQFIRIARGSLYEAVTCLEIARRLGYSDSASLNGLSERYDHLAKQMNAYLAWLKTVSVREESAEYAVNIDG